MIPELLPAHAAAPYQGHAHFWDRAMSRGTLLKTAAAGVGATMVLPALARGASNSTLPRHIPGGIQPFGPGTEVFHLFLPGPENEPATIFNFRGDVGLAALNGMGTHVNTVTGKHRRLPWEVDLRFYKGTYVDRAGHTRHATFGFI